MKRLSWIDISRAMGMFLIIMAHSITSNSGWSQYLSCWAFAVNVPIFFVLSGYLYRDKPFFKILKGGFVNLLCPYIFTALIMILLSLLRSWKDFQYLNLFAGGPKEAIKAALYGSGTSLLKPFQIPAIGAIWFLLAMFIGNQLYALIMKLKVNDAIKTCMCVLFTVIGFEIAKFILLPWSFNAALVSLIFYHTGYLIRKYNLIEKAPRHCGLLVLAVWIIDAAKGPFYMNIAYAANPLMAVLGGISGSYTLMLSAKWVSTKSFWGLSGIEKYGELSLIALAIHIIELNCLADFDVISKILGNVRPSIFTLILIVERVLVSVGGTVIVPKIPILRGFYMYRQYPLIETVYRRKR